MKIFTRIYDYIIKLANKKNVLAYLYGLSFIESFIFPIPPDVLLAPIALTKKRNRKHELRKSCRVLVFAKMYGVDPYTLAGPCMCIAPPFCQYNSH